MLEDTVRTLLRRALSPRAFDFVRICWWHLSFYFPGLVTSLFVKRKPEVRGFGGGVGASHLVKQVRSVNALVPTKMCRVMVSTAATKVRAGTLHHGVFGPL
jgi:hypothetical protein